MTRGYIRVEALADLAELALRHAEPEDQVPLMMAVLNWVSRHAVLLPEPVVVGVDPAGPDPEPAADPVPASVPDGPPAPAVAGAGGACGSGGRRDWTEGEVACLIRMIGRGSTQREVARAVGRSAGAVAAKVSSLGGVDAVVREARKAAEPELPAEEAQEPEEPEPRGGAPDEAGEDPDPLGTHLRRVMLRSGSWTVQQDHDLMHFAELGWSPDELAAELDVPVASIKPRFELLTDRRRFARADVLAALDAMLPGS